MESQNLSLENKEISHTLEVGERNQRASKHTTNEISQFNSDFMLDTYKGGCGLCVISNCNVLASLSLPLKKAYQSTSERE